MAFNPDAYLAKKSSPQKVGGFNPDAYLAEKAGGTVAQPTAQAKESPGLLKRAESALEGFGQAATFGYLPQIQGAVAQGVDYLTGQEPEDYTKSRDVFIKRGQALQEAAPGSYLGGQIAGSVATPALGVGGAATTLGKVGKAALSGAATGALYNPGDVEGELSGIQGKERLKQGLTGGAFGGAGQLASKALGGGLSAWSKKGKGLEKASNTMAVTAAGAMTPELRKLYDKKSIDRVGKFLKDERLVGPGKTVADTLESTQKIMSEVGEEIGSIYDRSKAQALSPKEFVTELDDLFSKELKGKPGGRQILSRVQSELENLKDLGDTATLPQILDFRRGVDDLINYDKAVRDMPGTQQALKKMRDYLKEKIDREVSKVDPKDLERLKELNKRYWNAADVESIGKRALAREESKMILGLPELIVGGAVGGTGAVNDVAQGRPEDALTSLAKGALAGGAFKLARKYGPGASAVGAEKLGRALQADPTGKLAGQAAGLLNRIDPGALGSTAERTRRKPKLRGPSGGLVGGG